MFHNIDGSRVRTSFSFRLVYRSQIDRIGQDWYGIGCFLDAIHVRRIYYFVDRVFGVDICAVSRNWLAPQIIDIILLFQRSIAHDLTGWPFSYHDFHWANNRCFVLCSRFALGARSIFISSIIRDYKLETTLLTLKYNEGILHDKPKASRGDTSECSPNS